MEEFLVPDCYRTNFVAELAGRNGEVYSSLLAIILYVIETFGVRKVPVLNEIRELVAHRVKTLCYVFVVFVRLF